VQREPFGMEGNGIRHGGHERSLAGLRKGRAHTCQVRAPVEPCRSCWSFRFFGAWPVLARGGAKSGSGE
jgi:hypothetical protein